jgi:hypothetical protein
MASADDPQKYLFKRTDFDRIPRWPNDGITQYREKNQQQQRSNNPRNNSAQVHPTQRAITDLLGEWPSEENFTEIEDDGSDFLILLPYTIQANAAQEQQNLDVAKKHMIEAYKRKEPAVRLILDQIGCSSALHKLSRDASRFPPFEAILAPLLQQNLASDVNLDLLFGGAANVRKLLFELGPMIKEPPPETSPAGAHLSSFLGPGKVRRAANVCAECGFSDGHTPFNRCKACKSVNYCSRDCQVKAWVIHKPDCLVLQGKAVSAGTHAKAEQEKQARQVAAENAENRKRSQKIQAVRESFQAFLLEEVQVEEYLYDCNGKRFKVHLPMYGLDIADNVARAGLELKFEERLSLGMFPDGIDPERYSFRGTLYSDPSNGGAKIIFLFIYLYKSVAEPCGCTGYAIDGIFVVDRVVGKLRAKWKLVAEPRNRRYTRVDFLEEYLKAAKEQAKAVSEHVDLGIHNPGDPDLAVIETAMGQYTTIS